MGGGKWLYASEPTTITDDGLRMRSRRFIVSALVLALLVGGCSAAPGLGQDSKTAGGKPFYEALLAGDANQACSLLPAAEQAQGECANLPQVAASLGGCRSASVAYESGQANAVFGDLNATFSPPCGEGFFVSVYGFGNNGRPISTCQLLLAQVNQTWRPTLQANFLCR